MMRKVYFAITMLLALAVFSCDFIPNAPDSEPIEYTADGRALVSLTIGKPNMSKALTAELARPGIDFYEVAFTDGAKIYRASWDYTQTGKIKVPTGNYDGAAKAVLFAGRYSDMTLLAVGKITYVDSTAISNAVNITSATKSVTFALFPLVTDVNGKIQTGSDVSSFQILTPTEGDADDPDEYKTIVKYATKELPYAKLGNKNFPIFLIPNDALATASFGLALGGSASFTDYNAAIRVLPGSSCKLYAAGVAYDDNPPVVLEMTSSKIVSPYTSTGTVQLPATIDMELIAKNASENGICKIAIEVAVVALGTTEAPHTWYVRGGLQNGLYDEGATLQSTGGSILIGIGNITGGFDIIVTPVP